MQITFNPYQFKTSSPVPAFKSNEKVFYNTAGKIVNKTQTYMFRNDLKWPDFAKYLDYKYENTKKLFLTDYACSDGSEAYTLAISLMEFAPETCLKAFPIKAKDKFADVIKEAQSGICNMYNNDMYIINHYTKNKFFQYFSPKPRTNLHCDFAVKPNEYLRNKIIFQQADILNDLDKLGDENNVILCRNFWKYLDKEKHHELAEKLYEKTKNNGLIVIGALEHKHNIIPILLQHGFRETYVDNVYEPIKRMTV